MMPTLFRSALLVIAFSTVACSPVLRRAKAGKNTATYYTAEGGVIVRGGQDSAYSYCVMPPAQGVRQRTGELEAKVTAKAGSTVNVGVEGKGGSNHETEKLYEHTDASLFMQHGLYRICEMNQNGAFDTTKQYREMTDKILGYTFDLIRLQSKEAEARRAEAELKQRELELESRSRPRRPAPAPAPENGVVNPGAAGTAPPE